MDHSSGRRNDDKKTCGTSFGLEEEHGGGDYLVRSRTDGEASGAGEARRTRSSPPSSFRTLIDEDLEEDPVDEAKEDYAIEVDDTSNGFDDGLDD
ncbi:hypothetical protein L1987_42722 [Smallanthus sonchifolius]|uniref:Uncharacterized protein n=1 Tax=Smallanthus sonchifolius TaxID=185202 RepID=A0ACB9GKB1_9ASTR|nr:hypothetical protein L1987_42722 [Smallanthus sonchifolius]